MSQGSAGAGGLKDAAASVAAGKHVDWAARAGLAARGGVYIVIGILAALMAQGSSGRHADQKGAFAELLSHAYGAVLVILLALGFVAYAIWRLSEAIYGVTGEGKGTGPRVKSAVRALVYFSLAGTAVSALLGSNSSQSSQQASLTARLLESTGGRLLVGLVGVVIIAVGVGLIIEGWKLKFMRFFKAVPANIRKLVVNLGRIGTIGRGAVFALAGLLILSAAWTLDPSKSGGLDAALRTLLAQPYGKVMGLATGLALIAFGIYGLAEARYRRV
jgi:hypothetical protein